MKLKAALLGLYTRWQRVYNSTCPLLICSTLQLVTLFFSGQQ